MLDRHGSKRVRVRLGTRPGYPRDAGRLLLYPIGRSRDARNVRGRRAPRRSPIRDFRDREVALAEQSGRTHGWRRWSIMTAARRGMTRRETLTTSCGPTRLLPADRSEARPPTANTTTMSRHRSARWRPRPCPGTSGRSRCRIPEKGTFMKNSILPRRCSLAPTRPVRHRGGPRIAAQTPNARPALRPGSSRLMIRASPHSSSPLHPADPPDDQNSMWSRPQSSDVAAKAISPIANIRLRPK